MANRKRFINQIFITPVSPKSSLDGEVWSVFMTQVHNWWLFDWVGSWVSFRLNNAKGKVAFSGRLTMVLIDSEKFHRNHLTILNFESKERFLRFVKKRLHRYRLYLLDTAISNTVAGLSTNIIDCKRIEGNVKVSLVYLVHVFENSDMLDFEQVKEELYQYDVFVHYAGNKSALIGYEDQANKTVPFDIGGILILASFEEEQFVELLKTSWYQEILNSNGENFVGIFKREV